MACKLATAAMLLAAAAVFQKMWKGDEWVRWMVVGAILALFVGSLVEAAPFLRQARSLRAKGWRLTFLDSALSLGSVVSWKLGYIPRRDDCLALPGFDAQRPDIPNIMRFLREQSKGE